MSFLGDSFKFENFRLGQMWDQLKSHPQRALFGGLLGMDPASTWLENKTTGSHFTPQTDALGGAYGGRLISAFGGGQQGGVYQTAREHGINPDQGAKLENAAHIAAGLVGAAYGGAALAGAGAAGGGAGAGAGAAGGLTEFTPAEIAAMGGGTVAPAAAAGGGSAAAGASSQPSWMQYARWANQARGLMGGGQQQGGAGPNDPNEIEHLKELQIRQAIEQLGRLGQQRSMNPYQGVISSQGGPTMSAPLDPPYMAQVPGGY